MSAHDDRWHRNFDAAQKRLDLKERAVAFLGGKCTLCPYDKCPAAFDFHHLDPHEKDFEISAKTVWDEALETELRKCVLVCSNCHREIHAGWHPQYLSLDEGNGLDDDEPFDAIQAALDEGAIERDAIERVSRGRAAVGR